MRQIHEVINKIQDVVPQSNEQAHADLKWLLRDCSYKAPEQASDQWLKLSEMVNGFLLDEPWKRQMVQILTDTEEQ